MRNIMAILWKQVKDTFKNKEILIQFVMFPVMTIVMEHFVKVDGMPAQYFTNLFGVMFVGMAPLTSTAAIISEEKEKNTLRALLMSNVKPWEYMIGVGLYIWCICMVGAGVIGYAGGHTGEIFMKFMVIMGIGILVSMLMGAAIGTWSKTQMKATSVTVPVMMIFSFLPMLSMFHEGIAKVAKFTYSQQIHNLISQLQTAEVAFEQVGVIGTNMLAAVVVFVIAYKKCGLE
ncbi:MAG: ABC transporter permease [Lachnospiraceae bacterium]|nr:ABC transporter permease [Lachnospiraceae bacterium]